MNEFKGLCHLQLNSISKIEEDPTLLKLTFSILDFEVSGNKQVVSKELALEAASTLRLKPLLCQYFPTTDYNNQNDHFGGHGQYKTKDRFGNEIILTNTIAIGTSDETGGYITTIKDDNGNDIEVLAADFYLWVDKYPDIANLIYEMWESGLPLKSSCEYLYKNYKVENGISYVLSPLIFVGHCILNSGENNTGIISPAYENSKLISFNERWQKAVSEAIKNQNSLSENVDINKDTQREVNNVPENLFYKTLCELSHGDIREKIMTALMQNMSAEEFQYIYVSSWGIYDTYFVYENYENGKYVNYKVSYTKTDNEVIVDMASKVMVERDVVWVEVNSMETIVNELNEKVNGLTLELSEANETIKTLNSEKTTIEEKFNQASESIVELNAKIEQLEPIVKQYNSEKLEQAIEAKKEYYIGKFKALNALEKFNTDEVQNLIKASVNDNEEGKSAILSLNTILVDLVQIKNNDSNPDIKEFSSKLENLIPTPKDFDSRYQN